MLQWKKANAMFVSPVINSEKRIKCKLKDLCSLAIKVSNDNVTVSVRDRFINKLDKLFDLFTCSCKILLCSKNSCEKNCDREAHIVCTCKKEKKFPCLELKFVRYQREKVETKSILQIAARDVIESKKQEKTLIKTVYNGKTGNPNKEIKNRQGNYKSRKRFYVV